MAVRAIVRLGHPVLRTAAAPVAVDRLRAGELDALIDDMVDTMREAQGVGLAAPQVGEGIQLFVYEAGGEEADADAIPLRVLANPMVEPVHGELVYDWEGCLSIPGLRGLVPRHPQVRVRALDRRGQPLDYVASGFEARIIQHEFDHLNGVVYLDRMRGLESLTFEEEFERFFLRDGEDDPEAAAVG